MCKGGYHPIISLTWNLKLHAFPDNLHAISLSHKSWVTRHLWTALHLMHRCMHLPVFCCKTSTSHLEQQYFYGGDSENRHIPALSICCQWNSVFHILPAMSLVCLWVSVLLEVIGNMGRQGEGPYYSLPLTECGYKMFSSLPEKLAFIPIQPWF